ncbi:hypothetical protein PN36_22140 [Candidatus Thiomargarita nelsonii]|uniref:Zinc resistance-associated protein n=1 Tax=Candidatus Thiomargarita nelsonii TaxID=1003181 RepID=A0A0A6P5J1_9GAMM|nr:hypothetical protein PN36_22140 [Candidatus Thiomargarita nelsonii]
MKKSTKIIIGTVLTVATLAGIAVSATPDHCGFGPEHRLEFVMKRLTNKLDLNAEQSEKLSLIKQQLMKRHQEMRQNHRDKILALLDEPVLDQQKAFAHLQNKMQQVKQNAPVLIAALAEFSDSLNNEQRAKLKNMLASFPKRGPQNQ